MKSVYKVAMAGAAFGAILLAVAVAEEILMSGLWRPFDIASYYGLAGSAVASIDAVLDASPASTLMAVDIGLLRAPAVFILLLSGALLVVAIGGRLYGENSGILAGLLFTLGIGGAQGHMAAGEALALALALLSAYCLLCTTRYPAAGVLAGIAVCFKPLTVVLLPLSLYYLYRKKNDKGAIAYGLPWIAALALTCIVAFALYGYNAMAMAANGGFELLGLPSAGAYRPADALMGAANVALSACMLASLLPLALMGFYRNQAPASKYFLAAGLLFIASLLPGQYLHYWIFALPFLALLCAGAFARRPANG